MLHYELDRSDIGKNEEIISYFNRSSNSIDYNFLGTPMSFIPIHTPFIDEDIKMRITTHVRKQLALGNNLRSTTVSGVQILN